MDYIISICINLLYFIYWLLIVKKENKLINLILFINILSPGFFINNTLFNLSDILIPIIYILFLFKTKFYIVNKKMPLLITFILLLFSIILSFLSSASTQSLSITMLFRGLRFLELFFSIIMIYNLTISKKNFNYIFKLLFNYSFLLMILCFCLFFYQDSYFSSIQSMWIGNIQLKRAAGIYKESSSFGYSCVLVSILSIYSLKINYRKGLSFSLLILSVLNNILSYTRITNIALLLILIIWFFQKITKTKIIILLTTIIVLLLLAYSNPIIQSFFVDRLLGLFNNSLESSSSGRFTVWSNTITVYINSNKFLFGLGYKYDGVLCDNGFLFALTNLGIFGLITYILFIIDISVIFINKKNYIVLYLFITMIVMSLTCDVLTYTRGLFILFIILVISTNLKPKQNITCRKENNKYHLV